MQINEAAITFCFACNSFKKIDISISTSSRNVFFFFLLRRNEIIENGKRFCSRCKIANVIVFALCSYYRNRMFLFYRNVSYFSSLLLPERKEFNSFIIVFECCNFERWIFPHIYCLMLETKVLLCYRNKAITMQFSTFVVCCC